MAYRFPRCQIVPLPGKQASFQIDGTERLRWHFSEELPRPCFYPLIGPTGSTLTRMGHPGAPNHDHHQSIWFAHNQVLGIDFWANGKPPRMRQREWLAYQDSDEEATMAVLVDWFDGHDPQRLLEQEIVAGMRPAGDGELLVELQTTFRPLAKSLEFGKTNFGFLAVRVAKNLSAYFGGGLLTNSEGAQGEPAIFAKPARWMDYSGPVPAGGQEGITYIDHPSNPGNPTHWHVRDDGWMCASPCLNAPLETTKEKPLVLRYLLLAHRGPLSASAANSLYDEFASSRPYKLAKAQVKHTSWSIVRA